MGVSHRSILINALSFILDRVSPAGSSPLEYTIKTVSSVVHQNRPLPLLSRHALLVSNLRLKSSISEVVCVALGAPKTTAKSMKDAPIFMLLFRLLVMQIATFPAAIYKQARPDSTLPSSHTPPPTSYHLILLLLFLLLLLIINKVKLFILNRRRLWHCDIGYNGTVRRAVVFTRGGTTVITLPRDSQRNSHQHFRF